VTGSIVQINISPGGVPKRPIAEAEVTPEGIRGDSWAHPQIHGGPNQALLLITSEGIGQLIAQGYPLFPGALGENLTTVGLDRRRCESASAIAGEVVLESRKCARPAARWMSTGLPSNRRSMMLSVKPAMLRRLAGGLADSMRACYASGVIRPKDIIELVDQVV
jgi:MOSC domain-containing protein YiiM